MSGEGSTPAADGTDVDRPVLDGLVRFSLTTANIGRLAPFYEETFDCRPLSEERRSGSEFERLMQVRGGADCRTLALGEQTIELLQFDQRGREYPAALSPYDPRFQHFAIVVADMRRALERLQSIGGWTPISRAGPQRLPPAAGNVTAFKFRDPDGHPLELLEFAAGRIPKAWQAPGSRLFLGIDHSAISVVDVARSVAFYEARGLGVVSRSLNRGAEQQALDGVSDPQVDVVALAPHRDTPHVELLGYRTDAPRPPAALHSQDVAATRLVFQASGAQDTAAGTIIRDPDGHCLQILSCLVRPL